MSCRLKHTCHEHQVLTPIWLAFFASTIEEETAWSQSELKLLRQMRMKGGMKTNHLNIYIRK